MLLTVAARDTDLTFGLYAGRGDSARLVRDWRIRTDNRHTADEFALTIRGMLGEHADDVTGVSVLSTVPPLRRELRAMMSRYYPDVPRVIIEHGLRTRGRPPVDSPNEVGQARLVHARAPPAL